MKEKEILQHLTALLPPRALLTDNQSLQKYGRDWLHLYEPDPLAIALPDTIEMLQRLVQLANKLPFALVPSGGRTGLSAGALARHREVVLSLERLNKILDFNEAEATLSCQAGATTAQLQAAAAEKGWLYPMHFSSMGSSHIGGNIATNAGGINVIRFGSTRRWVTAIKVVTGSGKLLDLNKGLIKNNTGYDLMQLFIGSEGTLGIIVEATLKVTRPLVDSSLFLLACPHLDQVLPILSLFQKELDICAFEFFCDASLQKVLSTKGTKAPLAQNTAYYVLIEFEAAHAAQKNKGLTLFEHCLEQNWIRDGIVCHNEEQKKKIWSIREDLPEILARDICYKNDISVRVSKIPSFLQAVDALMKKNYPEFACFWFGHIGDGNVHFNILKPTALPKAAFVEKCRAVDKKLYGLVEKFAGSIAAEHGVGITKKDYLQYTKSTLEILAMKEIKKIFDPIGILNPGKIFS